MVKKYKKVKEPDVPIIWKDICELNVEGKGWTDKDEFYSRLPAKAKTIVKDSVWKLGLNTAGICVRFITDATTIKARWTLRFKRLALARMSAIGVSGLDLYIKKTKLR